MAEGISCTSTYPMLSRSNKIRQCMWSTTLTRKQWSGISNSISFAYLHGYTEEMEHCGERNLWSYYFQGAEHIVHKDYKPLARFLNGKNTNNKVNRWGLELATYNITFEWILAAQNKAADYLSRLVELPQDKHTTVQMLSATNHNGPTFHTRS